MVGDSELGGSFCGFGATQLWQDFYLWEHILNDVADRMVGIVELGTAYGGFSLYLLTQAQNRGLGFATFDSIDHAHDPVDQLFGRPSHRPPVPWQVWSWFKKVNLLQNLPAGHVVGHLIHGPVVLFCDNGNKAQEVQLYSPFLAPGSLCLVHDWKTEIFPADIPDYMEERYAELCDRIGSITRVFEVINTKEVNPPADTHAPTVWG